MAVVFTGAELLGDATRELIVIGVIMGFGNRVLKVSAGTIIAEHRHVLKIIAMRIVHTTYTIAIHKPHI